MLRVILFVAVALFALAHGIEDVSAQSYPQRAVKFICRSAQPAAPTSPRG